MSRHLVWLLVFAFAGPACVYGIYRLAKGLGFLDPPWNAEHEQRRTIVVATYALLLSLSVFIFGYATGWPRAWAFFGALNGIALGLFGALGFIAARRLWKLRHPSPGAAPSPARKPPAAAADEAGGNPLV